MTGGFGGLQVADGEDADVRWAGVSRILGPRWAQLPLLTIGLLGVQILWSVEMSYGEQLPDEGALYQIFTVLQVRHTS